MSTATTNRVTGEMLATMANGQPKPVARLKLSRLVAYSLALLLPGVILVVVKWLGVLAQGALVEVSSFTKR